MKARAKLTGPRLLIVGAPAFVLAALTLTWSFGAGGEIADLFLSRQYNQARTLLAETSENNLGEERLFWQAHLCRSADEALAFLHRGVGDGRLPVTSRFRLELDAASIELARGEFRQALAGLLPLLEEHADAAPGEAFLLASIGLRALGEHQRAREMLASVRQDDPSFQLARYYLGEISLELGDPVLALRYFDSAAAVSAVPPTRILAGRWQALRNLGQTAEAADLLRSLEQDAPGSLALLEIRHQQRLEQEESAARAAAENLETLPAAEEAPPTNGGRYSLQLGAFSDRSLALDFLRRYSDQETSLRIDEVQDERGQFLYKVRTGYFVSRAQATSQAHELGRRLRIEIFVTDLTD